MPENNGKRIFIFIVCVGLLACGVFIAYAGESTMNNLFCGAGKVMQNITTSGVQCVEIGSGGGDVIGSPPSTDDAIARYDGTSGKIIQNSAVTINDSGAMLLDNAQPIIQLGGSTYSDLKHSLVFVDDGVEKASITVDNSALGFLNIETFETNLINFNFGGSTAFYLDGTTFDAHANYNLDVAGAIFGGDFYVENTGGASSYPNPYRIDGYADNLYIVNAIDDVANKGNIILRTKGEVDRFIFDGAGLITSSGLANTNRVLISDANKKIIESNITNTVLFYLNGTTSNIQTQINTKGGIGNCTSGSVVQNVTTSGVQCITDQTGGGSFTNNITGSGNAGKFGVWFNSTEIRYSNITESDIYLMNTSIWQNKLNITDQRFNETARIDTLNTSKANISICTAGQYMENATTSGAGCKTLPVSSTGNVTGAGVGGKLATWYNTTQIKESNISENDIINMNNSIALTNGSRKNIVTTDAVNYVMVNSIILPASGDYSFICNWLVNSTIATTGVQVNATVTGNSRVQTNIEYYTSAVAQAVCNGQTAETLCASLSSAGTTVTPITIRGFTTRNAIGHINISARTEIALSEADVMAGAYCKVTKI